ncbi:MAG TPA: N-acetylmuramoyl-L-alanine amidase family protein [Candidatus Lachnoclostridium pullistercoris]|uniref:N-acetylmuramoyl-L-alanine amidase family protein n=1 Tax=Candidatus Lachnoclostridium pullistercoris TaxID=2838632 RepID=A0A9D2PFD6_9FIRM|nr:N-acetylmuramoyl-L-alanine amidase family protein [Candidatus Lachnoclostridium pullistercoris]
MKKYNIWKKLLTASLLFSLLSAPFVQAAETRTPIEHVNLYVDGDRNDGWNEDITLKLSTPDTEYRVGDWYLSNSNTASVPIFKVELYAKNGYYFDSISSDDVSLSGLDARCTGRSTRDDKETLLLTLKVEGLEVDLDNGGDADLDEDGYGTWDEIPGAHHYEVRLYRNDKSFSSIRSTSDTSYDFSSLITRSGDYYFRVRAVGSDSSDKGEWIESGSWYFDDPLSYDYHYDDCSGVTYPGSSYYSWIPSGGEWFLRLSDGTYAVNSWQYVDGNWFYFDASGRMLTGWFYDGVNWFYLNPVSDGTRGAMKTGWVMDGGRWYYLNTVSDGTRGAMKTGWISVYGKEYYLNPVSDGTRGALYVNCITPDGKRVGPDGARVY